MEEPVEGRHKICGNPQVLEPSASRADRFLLPSLLHAERSSKRDVVGGSGFRLEGGPVGPETLPLLTEAADAPEDGQGHLPLRWRQVFPDKVEVSAIQLGEVYAGIAAGVARGRNQLSLDATDGLVGHSMEMRHIFTLFQSPRVPAVVKCKRYSIAHYFAYIGVDALKFV